MRFVKSKILGFICLFLCIAGLRYTPVMASEPIATVEPEVITIEEEQVPLAHEGDTLDFRTLSIMTYSLSGFVIVLGAVIMLSKDKKSSQ